MCIAGSGFFRLLLLLLVLLLLLLHLLDYASFLKKKLW